jgi:cell division protein FtsB
MRNSNKMPVNKLQFSVACALMAAGGTLLGLAQHRAHAKLRVENLALQQQIHQLTSSALGRERISNPLVGSLSSPASQLAELGRLRVETDAQKREIEKLRGEIAATPVEPPPPTLPFSMLFVHIPKESWAFAGYATPEDALQSMLWATREGDVNALRDSLTSGELQRRGWNGKTDEEIAAQGIQGLSLATGFQILKIEMLAADDAHLTVYIDGFNQSDQPMWMEMKQVGEEWKADAYEHHRN